MVGEAQRLEEGIKSHLDRLSLRCLLCCQVEMVSSPSGKCLESRAEFSAGGINDRNY